MKRSAYILVTLFLTIGARSASADEGASKTPETAAVEKKDVEGTPAPAKEETVLLHVTSTSPVTIERDDTGETVCTSPCDVKVPASAHYRIGGSHRTDGFTLKDKEGRANVRVKTGGGGMFWAGTAVLGLGGALIAGGVGTLIYGYSNQAEVPGGDGENTDNSYTDLMALGTTLCVAGVVAGIWGGATMISNASTKLGGDLHRDAHPAAQGRAPTFRSTAEARPVGPAFYVPVLQGTF